jgi:hypothetical protein
MPTQTSKLTDRCPLGTILASGRGRRSPRSLAILLAAAVLATPASGNLGLPREHRIVQSQVGGVNTAGDQLGATLACGDFDGDGFLDLAVGAPDDNPGAANAGAVYVLYGSPSGLNAAGGRPALLLHQDQAGVDDTAEAEDRFGAALAVGNFNGDPYDDLAVGIPGEDSGFGAIQVFPGSATGIDPAGDEIAYNSVSVFGGFGVVLAAGPVNADPFDELLVGFPSWGIIFPATADIGAVFLFFGTAAGLAFDTPTQGTGQDQGDRFGAAVALGHVNADGDDAELVVGAPFAEVGGPANEGIVSVVGDAVTTIEGGAADAQLGAALVVDDFLGAGYPQILVGLPGASVSGQASAGGAILYGLGIFPIAVTQGNGFPQTAEAGDRAGGVLGSGDFDGDGRADAVLGVPHEALGLAPEAGVVQIVYGDYFAQGRAHFQLFGATDFGDTALPSDLFGAAVAAGDFDGDGYDDLAIGIPGANAGGQAGAGAIQIVYGVPLLRDGFESGNTSAWSG